MLERLQNWDRKLEKVVKEIDRTFERVTPVTTKGKTQAAPQTKRVS